MRVIWISNIAFGPLCELAGLNKSSGGSWLDAAYQALEFEKELELIIITVSRVKEIRIKKEGNHTFCILPGGFPSEYDYTSPKNRRSWETIRSDFQPDLIQIWGTEFTHGYLALQVMQGIPSVIYMQGLMGQIARHYLSGITDNDLKHSITLRDIIKLDWIKRQQADFLQRSLIESSMIRISENVIVENDWCESHCKAIASNCTSHKSKLNIKEDFYKQEWKSDQMQPYTIMSNAAGYPIKGLHMLIKALSLVIQKYPETMLFIPGEKSPFDKSFLEKCRISGYTKFIKTTIEKLHLKGNIHFLGQLNSSQMADQMAKSNVFVMPSSIENHSSTLIEAMIVGTPCISSYVGGVPEYLTHNVNGLIYRFEEYEILASHIIKIFDNKDFAMKIAMNGKNAMRISREANNIKEEFLSIYHKLLGSKSITAIQI